MHRLADQFQSKWAWNHIFMYAGVYNYTIIIYYGREIQMAWLCIYFMSKNVMNNAATNATSIHFHLCPTD